jgi:hypothetical protein
MTYSKEHLERTIKVWQPYSKEPLSLADAEEICGNMANLCKYLIELDGKYGKAELPHPSSQ